MMCRPPQRVTLRAVGPFVEIRVRSGVEQALHDAHVVALGGSRQGPLTAWFLVVGETGVRRQQFANALLVAQSGGDGDRIARAPREQPAGDCIVVALPPVRMVPERRDHRTESGSAEPVVAAEPGRVHVRTTVDEEVDEVGVACFDGVVQGSSTEVVTMMRQAGFLREKRLDRFGVACCGCVMNGMATSGGGGPKSQLVAEQVGDFVVTTVERDLQEWFLRVQRPVKDVGTGFQQQTGGTQVAFAHGEVQGRCIPEL